MGRDAMDLLERIANLEAEVAKLKREGQPTRAARAGVVKYAVIAMIVAFVIMTAAGNLGNQLNEKFDRISTTLPE